MPVVDRLFTVARALAQKAIAVPDVLPEFARWLNTLLQVRDGSDEWEDTLFEIIDYFGLSEDAP